MPPKTRTASRPRSSNKPRRPPASVTKAILVDRIMSVCSSRAEAASTLDAVLESIAQALQRGETVKITRFGNFVVQDKRSRMGRNPATGESIRIEARRVVKFRPSLLWRSNRG